MPKLKPIAQEKLVKFAEFMSQLGIEDQKVNRAAAQQFIKLAWDEFFEGSEYGAAEEEAEEEAEEAEEEAEEKTSEEAPFDLAAAVSSLPKTRKVWEMLKLKGRDVDDEGYKIVWSAGSPTFKGDVEALNDFIKQIESSEEALQEQEKHVFRQHVIGDVRAGSFLKLMIGHPVRNRRAWDQSPFKGKPELQGIAKNAIERLKSSDPVKYAAISRLAASVFARFHPEAGAAKGPNWKARAAELASVIEMIQGSQEATPDSTEQPTFDSVPPPQGADKNVSFANKDIERGTPQQQVAETLDRWKTLAGIITESEEK